MKTTATILIVDDMAENIRLLANILQDDYHILVATDGRQALKIAENKLPDLILLDVIMPEMNGHQLLTRLQAKVETANIPVIFVTALDQVDDQAAGLELGAIDYLVKPIHPTLTKLRVKNQLELKQQRDHLMRLSMIDGLTGIANRRQFDDLLQREWHRCQRYEYPLSLIMIDVDYFKPFNDTYGHQLGDECIQRVAQCIKSNLHRPSDLAARYGGDEFICLLADTDLEGTQKVAVNIGQSVSALNIIHATSEVADHVTVSIGQATMKPDHERQANDLIGATDKKLYEAKKQGRNRNAL